MNYVPAREDSDDEGEDEEGNYHGTPAVSKLN
jgi:hypothetical protein